MEEQIEYKGYFVTAFPYKQEGWHPEVTIARPNGPHTRHGRVTVLKTRDEAVQESLSLGMQIIDGLIPQCRPPV